MNKSGATSITSIVKRVRKEPKTFSIKTQIKLDSALSWDVAT